MEILTKTGRLLYGAGITCIGIQHFIYKGFRPMIVPDWPAWLHTSPVWACLAGAVLVITGLCIVLGKKVKEASLFLGVFLLLLFVGFHVTYLLFIGPNSPRHLGLWTNPLKELAMSGGAFVMAGSFAGTANNHISMSPAQLVRLGSIFFGIVMTAFGIDHFLYPAFVETLVPGWIPSPVFWTYFSGAALILSGAAIVFRLRISMVALLLGMMLLLWVVVLHIPRAITDYTTAAGNEVTSVFQALAFSGIAFVIAAFYKKRAL